MQAYVLSETEELVGLSMAQKNDFGKEEFSTPSLRFNTILSKIQNSFTFIVIDIFK